MKYNKSNKALKGISWSAIERFSVQGIQFLITIILARLLSPSDFGTIALVITFLGILQTLNESGFNVALAQKLDRSDIDYSSVFIFNVVTSIVMYGGLFISAPYIASFFNNPILVEVIRIVGINLIISSFTVIQSTILMIKVDFKTQAKASFISVIISGLIGIFLAYNGYGVFSLVFQSILNNFVNAILLWYFSRWSPQLKFSTSRFKGIFSYAYKLILARLIDVMYQNIFTLVIGKFYSANDLGYYNRANSFTSILSNNITSIIQRVSTPLLCESQNNLVQLKEYLSKFMLSAAIIVFPSMFILFILAEPIISITISDKWLPSAPLLRLLSPIGILYLLNTFNRNVYNAINRTDLALKLEIVKKIIFTTILIITLQYGIKIMLIGQILSMTIEYFINTFFINKHIKFKISEQLQVLSGVFVACIIMSLVMIISTIHINNTLTKLIIGIISGGITYIFICWTLNIGNIKQFITNYLQHKE